MRIPGNKPPPEAVQNRQAKTSLSTAGLALNRINRPAAGDRPKPLAPQPNRTQPTARILQQKTAKPGIDTKATLKAPPPYRPMPVPKVLQTKSRVAANLNPQFRQPPTAPPVYRPQQPKVLQAMQSSFSRPHQSTSRPGAPPVYRPLALPRVLQPKIGTAVMPPRHAGKGVIQLIKHVYQGTGGFIDEIKVDADARNGLMTLKGVNNSEVVGKLAYYHEGEATSLSSISTFPHGYGLGAVLMYHLGEKALANNSKQIKIGAPALFEWGFYRRLGATTVETELTHSKATNLLGDADEREYAWINVLSDMAEKKWDSQAYFLGGVNAKFFNLDPDIQQSVKSGIDKSISASDKERAIDTQLNNRAAYQTDQGGFIFRDINEMMENCLASMRKNWIKIS